MKKLPTYSDGTHKPPTGLIPRWLITEKRMTEIVEAMSRFRGENMEIPKEWLDELMDLQTWYKNYKDGK